MQRLCHPNSKDEPEKGKRQRAKKRAKSRDEAREGARGKSRDREEWETFDSVLLTNLLNVLYRRPNNQ